MLKPLSTLRSLEPSKAYGRVRAAKAALESLDGGQTDVDKRKDVVSLTLPGGRRLDAAIFTARDGYVNIIQKVTEVSGDYSVALVGYSPECSMVEEFFEITTQTNAVSSGQKLVELCWNNKSRLTDVQALGVDELSHEMEIQGALLASRIGS